MELKPCPFCGKEATLFQIPDNSEEEGRLHPRWTWNNSGLWVVGCDTPMCLGNYNNEAMVFFTSFGAKEAWNRRQTDERII